jgi:hypothetical protein
MARAASVAKLESACRQRDVVATCSQAFVGSRSSDPTNFKLALQSLVADQVLSFIFPFKSFSPNPIQFQT